MVVAIIIIMEIMYYHHNSRLIAEIADLCQVRPHKYGNQNTYIAYTHSVCLSVCLPCKGTMGCHVAKGGNGGKHTCNHC